MFSSTITFAFALGKNSGLGLKVRCGLEDGGQSVRIEMLVQLVEGVLQRQRINHQNETVRIAEIVIVISIVQEFSVVVERTLYGSIQHYPAPVQRLAFYENGLFPPVVKLGVGNPGGIAVLARIFLAVNIVKVVNFPAALPAPRRGA
jgi:hypothetical protein